MPVPPTIAHLLAVAGQTPDMSRVFVPMAILVLVIIVMAAVLLAVRRRLLAGDEPEPGEGLTLHDLRTMHSDGKITDEEFEAMKRVILPSRPETHPDVLALRGAGNPSEDGGREGK